MLGFLDLVPELILINPTAASQASPAAVALLLIQLGQTLLADTLLLIVDNSPHIDNPSIALTPQPDRVAPPQEVHILAITVLKGLIEDVQGCVLCVDALLLEVGADVLRQVLHLSLLFELVQEEVEDAGDEGDQDEQEEGRAEDHEVDEHPELLLGNVDRGDGDGDQVGQHNQQPDQGADQPSQKPVQIFVPPLDHLQGHPNNPDPDHHSPHQPKCKDEASQGIKAEPITQTHNRDPNHEQPDQEDDPGNRADAEHDVQECVGVVDEDDDQLGYCDGEVVGRGQGAEVDCEEQLVQGVEGGQGRADEEDAGEELGDVADVERGQPVQ